MPFNIVLVQPLIAQNTGTIARLTAATNTMLHIIEPLGFKLTDKHLKRAGLDYWPEVKYLVHRTWEDFLLSETTDSSRFWFFTTHANKSYFEAKFSDDDYFVFGNESHGLDRYFHEQYENYRLKIPMFNQNIRCLNLANACSIILYEAIRQTITSNKK